MVGEYFDFLTILTTYWMIKNAATAYHFLSLKI